MWYPRLLNATQEQNNWKIIGGGYGIHWPAIDEDLSTEGLLRGRPAPRQNSPSTYAATVTSKENGEAVSEGKGIWDYVAEGEEASEEFVNLMSTLTVETQTLTNKVNRHSENIAKIAKSGGPKTTSRYRGVASLLATNLNDYSKRIEGLLPDVNEAVEALESSYSNIVDFIDPKAPDSEGVVASFRSRLSELLAAVGEAKQSVVHFNEQTLKLSEQKVTRELSEAVNTLLKTIAGILASYEEMESFGLKVMFRIDEKFTQQSGR